jgi:soluble lytic murein transglycosylase-like protein
MSIDPRTMAQLIKLQLLDYTGMTESGSSTSLNGGSDFMDMLQSLMNSSLSEPAAAAQSATAAPAGLNRLAVSAIGSMPIGMAAAPATDASGYASLIKQVAASRGLEESLVNAVIDAESSFNARSVSPAGAKGLMQLMDGTSHSLGVTDPFDPVQNVQAGTQYLANMLNKYGGNKAVALAAYNAGPSRIDSLGIRSDSELMEKYYLLPKETQSYVQKVLHLQQAYR